MNFRRVTTAGIIIVVLLACLPIARTTPQNIRAYELDDILHARFQFNDLFGKPITDLIERFGPPKKTDGDTLYFVSAPDEWKGFSATLLEGKLFGVRLYPTAFQTLDVRKVIQKAPSFCFSSGTFSSSATQYFNAETKDGKTHLQFLIDGTSISFSNVIFTDFDSACNPSAVGH